jgi:glycosyltransferase involved in cell wall biosynthesis
VVFAVPDFEPAVGGTPRQVGLQARALASLGYDVTVVTRRRDRSWPRDERLDGGVCVRRIGRPGRGRAGEMLALLSLAAWLARRRRRIRVVATVMWPDSQLAAFAARLLPRTVTVWAIRGEAETVLARRPGPLRRLLVRLRQATLRRTAHVVLTPAMADELEGLGLRDSNVIPVPVDCSHFRPPVAEERRRARARLGIDDDAFVAVYVGHLEARKAVDRLVEALGQLARSVPAPRLLLVGGARGTAEDTELSLRGLVARLGLDGAVAFCGVQRDPRPFLWAADVLVLPSVREGMPNSLLEAMACGLPCVAPASAGGDELLDPETGIVPPSNEPAELEGALARLAESSLLRARLGLAARARVQRYDVDAVARQYDELFRRIARGLAS